MLKTKVTRVKGGSYGEHFGAFHSEPMVGEPFAIGEEYETPPITNIIDDEVFECGEEVYVWAITNGDF